MKKMKATKKSTESDEEQEENEKNFQDLPTSSRYSIINDIWDKLQKDHSPKMASQIITAIYNQKVKMEEKKLTPVQTLQLLKKSGITIEALRKIRSGLNNFGAYNPFASEPAVNKERAKIYESVKIKKEKIPMSNTVNGPKVDVDVYSRESVLEELQNRINGIIEAGNYEPFFVDGEEVIAGLITQDKATDYSKICMAIGNSKAPINSAYALSLLCYFKANDSPENLYAALDRENGIGPQIDNITELTVTINGVTKTLKVKWFAIGDFKFLNAIAGLNSNSCSFPCWNCEQKIETTYSELNLDDKAPERTIKVDANKSQIRLPIFKTIPFHRFIPPILHITLGPGAQLFEALCERARQLDNTVSQAENVDQLFPDDKTKKLWEASQFKIQTLKETLENLNYQLMLFDDLSEEGAIFCESTDCVASRDGINVNNIYEVENFCYQCQKYFHKCCLYKGQCPHCVKRSPTSKQSRDIIAEDRKEIEKQVKQRGKELKEEEKKSTELISKYKLGSFAANVEKILEKYGGSRKAYFQSFTGKQLTKMGKDIQKIYFDFDEKLQEDPEIRKILRAIIKFFDIKKLLTTAVLEDAEIDEIDHKIKDLADYMKENLPHFRVLQKGHSFFKHLVSFMRKYKIAGYFTDEAIESFHVIFNKYTRRIGNRSPDKYAELMFNYNSEDTFIHDRFGYTETYE